MWIESLEVHGFLGRDRPVSARFNRDLNIITGRNGAGKTNLLKLIWYIMSGNILEALREVAFDKATLVTSEYSCTVHRMGDVRCRVEIEIGQRSTTYEDFEDEDGHIFENAEDLAGRELQSLGSSIFFPTFRRIEGGFTLNTTTTRTISGFPRRPIKRNAVEEALDALSVKLSNGAHKFVAAISTVDIVEMLYRHYTDLTETYNNLQRKMSQDIIGVIKRYQITGEADANATTAEQLLGSIRAQIENVEISRERIMLPIGAIQKTVESLFTHKGIKVGRLSFGDAAAAINSDTLSAGEKQMLSFISYNGLYDHSSIFVDEPELSLHVDWQRSLFATLQRQEASNQFVIATHSPFIYSKYPDKEILIDVSRGDTEGFDG
jgi:AAA15 family ATPase/GTPase